MPMNKLFNYNEFSRQYTMQKEKKNPEICLFLYSRPENASASFSINLK